MSPDQSHPHWEWPLATHIALSQGFRVLSCPTWAQGDGDAQLQAPPLQPGPPRPKRPLPLRGSTGRGTQQVLEETLELWVPGGLQAARVPEGDIPQRSFGCSW